MLQRRRPWSTIALTVVLALVALLLGPVPAHAAGTGTITGSVWLGSTTLAGAGEVSVLYTLSGQTHQAADVVQTNASGGFTIAGLPLGSYELYYQYNGTGPWVSSWYNANPNAPGHGASIYLSSGSPSAGASTTLRPMGTLTGQLTLGSAGTIPAAGEASVSYRVAYTVAGNTPWTTVTTDGDGRISVPNLLPGFYDLQFRYSGTANVQKFAPMLDQNTISSGMQFVSGQTDISLAFPDLKSLSGTVLLGSSSTPAGAGEVTVTPLVGSYLEGAVPITGYTPVTTDASGHFVLTGIAAANIYLQFDYTGSGYFQRTYRMPTYVTVQQNAPAPTVSVTIPGAMTVGGQIYFDDPFTPVRANQVRVSLTPYSGAPLTALTNAQGRWEIRSVPPGSYTVCAQDLVGSRGTKCWEHARGPYGSAPLPLLSTRSDLDFVLGAEGSIVGAIRHPVDGYTGSATVYLTGIMMTGPNAGRVVQWETVSGGSGIFSFGSLSSNLAYAIEVYPMNPVYAPQSWEGMSAYYYPDLFTLTYGAAEPVVYLQRAGSITGVVSGTRLDPARLSSVTAEVMVFDYSTNAWVPTGDVYPVGADGSYTIPGLAPDRYRVRFAYSSGGIAARAISTIVTLTEGPSPAAPTVVTLNGVLNLPPATTRLNGADRYSVAVTVSQQQFPNPVGDVPVVYIAQGGNFPDALSAAPAAAHEGGPLLLTPSASLRDDVRQEILRLGPDRIVIVGGERSITPAVEAALAALVPVGGVSRVTGSSRYEASRGVIEQAWDVGVDSFPIVYVTTGTNFPDALSASAAAAMLDAPVLLVPGPEARLDAATRALLTRMAPDEIRVAGGAVSAGIRNDLAQILNSSGAPTRVVPLGGADRFAASQAINANAYTSATTAYLTTGYNFPDGLAGAALAGSRAAPLYTVPTTCVPTATLAQLDALGVDNVVVLGGTATLTTAVQSLTPCVSGARSLGTAPDTVAPQSPDGRPLLGVDADWRDALHSRAG